MTIKLKHTIMAVSLGSVLSMMTALPATAAVSVQCPGDTDGSATWGVGETQPSNTKCMHLGAGDGFVTMADGRPQYMFGFTDLTGLITKPANPGEGDDVMMEGMLGGEISGTSHRTRRK